jgi:D-glycero-alpha-D-manno-heptose-7-phosphate kinase
VHLACSAPTRIDLAGGTIDIWPLYLFHPGAQTLNAAISLRAHASFEELPGDRVRIHSVDTGRTIEAGHWSELGQPTRLHLLSRILHFFQARGLALTTRGESPAGAGIAGSSALTIAVCAGMARWTGADYPAERLLTLAMNLEAQAIDVPTGLQDYRPACYGGVAALEMGPDGANRVPLDVDPHELERRVVLAYTGEPRQSGTNNWEIFKRHIDGDRHVFDCFERIRDTAARMRIALLGADWEEVGRQIAAEWDNRKRLAPGVTTPAIETLIARSAAAGAEAAKVCGAGGGGCLFCWVRPERAAAVRDALVAGGARLLEYRIETEGLRFR